MLFSSTDLDAGGGQEAVNRYLQIARRRTFANAARRCRTANHGSGRASRRNRLPASAAWRLWGVQPRWVQTPTRISHSGLMARLASVAGALSGRLSFSASGSGRLLTGTALAAAISAGVRRRTNSGWPRNLKTICWPGWMAERSISIGARSQRSGGRVHLVDERPCHRGNAHSTNRARRHIKKIASRARVTRRSCHWVHPYGKRKGTCSNSCHKQARQRY